MRLPGAQDRVRHVERRKALVHNPCKWLDVRTCKIALQLHCLMDWRCLWERHQQHMRELRIPQARQQPLHSLRTAAWLLQDFAVVGLGRVQQEQRVSRGRRVNHNKAVFTLRHRLRKGAEHGDLLGAGTAEVLFQKRLALRVKAAAR